MGVTYRNIRRIVKEAGRYHEIRGSMPFPVSHCGTPVVMHHHSPGTSALACVPPCGTPLARHTDTEALRFRSLQDGHDLRQQAAHPPGADAETADTPHNFQRRL
jgi:hypothetical protein